MWDEEGVGVACTRAALPILEYLTDEFLSRPNCQLHQYQLLPIAPSSVEVVV